MKVCNTEKCGGKGLWREFCQHVWGSVCGCVCVCMYAACMHVGNVAEKIGGKSLWGQFFQSMCGCVCLCMYAAHINVYNVVQKIGGKYLCREFSRASGGFVCVRCYECIEFSRHIPSPRIQNATIAAKCNVPHFTDTFNHFQKLFCRCVCLCPKLSAPRL